MAADGSGTLFDWARELVVDNYCGGGGASTGIEAALGRAVDFAVNHSPEAIAVHRANHPRTRHFVGDVWEVRPTAVTRGRPVALAWFSPDCRHFSRAKGGKPRSKKVRALAWLVICWARETKPRVICLENVSEWLTWGPLDNEGNPIAAKAGLTFRNWLGKLRAQGYVVEWRELCAADYGAPTTRRRLFLIARRDGQPIAWPAPTHAKDGKGGLKPWRTAAEIIDWSISCPSIFDRPRPLAEATLRRIAAGVMRYVVQSARPFVVKYHGGERGHTRGQSVDEPLRTLDTSNRFALVAPVLIAGYGEREGQAPRAASAEAPLGTVVATAKHRLVVAFLTKHYGGVVGHEVTRPLGVVTTQDHHALTTATLAPEPTDRSEQVRAFLLKYYSSSDEQGQSLDEPLHTITTKARFGLVTVSGVGYHIVDIGMRMFEPEELKRAHFPATYQLAVNFNGRALSKAAQTRLVGNSVVCAVAEALVRANLRPDTATKAA